MTTGALIFLLASWSFVLGLTFWAFARILRQPRRPDPDAAGLDDPAAGREPPVAR
ncbi:MAG TPA: hypothetical protein VFX29_04520 [Longimicrobiaceae bacterium]|jgi:hypothetical protein|nr:hypothetical protein [Longimicrobiaceae bacterium]